MPQFSVKPHFSGPHRTTTSYSLGPSQRQYSLLRTSQDHNIVFFRPQLASILTPQDLTGCHYSVASILTPQCLDSLVFGWLRVLVYRSRMDSILNYEKTKEADYYVILGCDPSSTVRLYVMKMYRFTNELVLYYLVSTVALVRKVRYVLRNMLINMFILFLKYFSKMFANYEKWTNKLKYWVSLEFTKF